MASPRKTRCMARGRRNAVFLVLPVVVAVCILATADAQSLRDSSYDLEETPTPTPAAKPVGSFGFSALGSTATDQQTASPTSGSSSAKACEWQGKKLRHNTAKYFVGRAHRRGSIFGECYDGALTCYEDTGVADVSSTRFRVIPCTQYTLAQRQYDLDLEDERMGSG